MASSARCAVIGNGLIRLQHLFDASAFEFVHVLAEFEPLAGNRQLILVPGVGFHVVALQPANRNNWIYASSSYFYVCWNCSRLVGDRSFFGLFRF